MNWDMARGNWTLFKDNMKLQWGNLTHDHLSKIAGRHGQLTGRIQKAYGATRQATEKQVKNFAGLHKHSGPQFNGLPDKLCVAVSDAQLLT